MSATTTQLLSRGEFCKNPKFSRETVKENAN